MSKKQQGAEDEIPDSVARAIALVCASIVYGLSRSGGFAGGVGAGEHADRTVEAAKRFEKYLEGGV